MKQGITGGRAGIALRRSGRLISRFSRIPVYRIARREFKQTFKSFQYRNFRLYFFGQLVSLSGTWMQNLALSWLVYRLTKSAWMLGLVSFAHLAPVLVFGIAAGWVADRLDRKKVLMATQMMAMVQAAVLATLTLSGLLEVWHILALATCLGIINAIEVPARQAFVANMVPRRDLVNAISLNTSVFHSTRTIGPALAGVLVGIIGEGPCFLVNAVSYLACLIALFMIRADRTVDGTDASVDFEALKSAFRFAFNSVIIRRVLGITAVMSFLGMQYAVLAPIFAGEVLHMKAGGLGALLAAAGLGALLAALTLANRGDSTDLKRAVGLSFLGFSVTLFVFALSKIFYVSMLLAAILGFFMTFQLSGSHSLVQLNVTDEIRGRVMSIYMTTFLGSMPLGALVVGGLANVWGAPLTMAGAACCCLVASLVYLTRKW